MLNSGGHSEFQTEPFILSEWNHQEVTINSNTYQKTIFKNLEKKEGKKTNYIDQATTNEIVCWMTCVVSW